MGWPHCKRLVKIGAKDWKKDWQKIEWFFFSVPTMPEKGKGKAQGGQDTREGGSSHEKRAAKKRKTQMGAQEIRVIDRRHHETGLWCFECANVFWAPSSADAKAVRYVHHVFCLGQNKSDFIGPDEACLRGGCVRSHAAHNVGSNLNFSNFSNCSAPRPLLVRTSSDSDTETSASASVGVMGYNCEARSFYM